MDWTRGPVLGRSSSATVSLATTSSSELFAVKSAELSSSTSLQKERDLISQLNSPYVIKYLGFDITLENNIAMFNLFIEYAQNGTLFDLIKKQGGSLQESLIQFYVYQILQGLDYLHSNGLVHCDIKAQNILICEDGVKIADFDCAKSVENRTTFSGTPIYMAPEVARGEEQGFAADIWSLGCMIIEMATGTNPWPGCKEPVSALYRIGYAQEEVELPVWFSGEAEEFLRNCLMRKPNERWTAKQLLGHKFLKDFKGNSKMEISYERISPTSILHQDIWDSFDVSEYSSSEAKTILNETNSSFILQSEVSYMNTTCSLSDRIKNLISDGGSSLNLPNWVDEDCWITVRGIDVERISNMCEGSFDIKKDCKNLVEAEDWAFGRLGAEEEPVSSISFQDSLYDYYDSEIRDVIRLDAETNLMTYGESSNHVLVTSTEFECNTCKMHFVKTCLHLLNLLCLLSLLALALHNV